MRRAVAGKPDGAADSFVGYFGCFMIRRCCARAIRVHIQSGAAKPGALPIHLQYPTQGSFHTSYQPPTLNGHIARLLLPSPAGEDRFASSIR